MNNAPLTLILIASLGIVAVISLGVFFAVRPKFADTDQQLAADFLEQSQAEDSGESVTVSSESIITTGDDQSPDGIAVTTTYGRSISNGRHSSAASATSTKVTVTTSPSIAHQNPQQQQQQSSHVLTEPSSSSSSVQQRVQQQQNPNLVQSQSPATNNPRVIVSQPQQQQQQQSPAAGPTFAQSSRQNGDREIVSAVELLDSLRVAPEGGGAGGGQEDNFQAAAAAAALFVSSSPPPAAAEEKSVNLSPPALGWNNVSVGDSPAAEESKEAAVAVPLRELALQKEVDMHRYGKVVGLAYRKGRLYVPSYQNGNISVYRADSTMQLLKEYSCAGCHIYDVGVLSNGDLVLSQGKYSKITKMDGKNGAVVKEVTVPYSAKGIAVSNYDEIFVLSRDHDAFYVYDSELKQLGSVPIDNKAKSDCNFLDYGDDFIYVSCESATHVISVQGKEVHTLRPSHRPQLGAFAIGIGVVSDGADGDKNNKVYVGQRGRSLVDVFDKNGNYLESVGEKKDSLWSDIAVGGKYLYVIEYITTTIKQYLL